MKKIFILVGHPDPVSMCCDFGSSYAKGATDAGNEVRLTRLGEMKFDPILHQGYKVVQPLEPDLLKFQEDVRWCDHFVIIYPSWWSTMPALLKGLFDRVWLPGFAFKFMPSGLGWHRLLKGKTARVFITSDSHPLIARFLQGDNTNEIQDGILWFAGFHARVQKVGPMKKISPEHKELWVKKFETYGKRVY